MHELVPIRTPSVYQTKTFLPYDVFPFLHCLIFARLFGFCRLFFRDIITCPSEAKQSVYGAEIASFAALLFRFVQHSALDKERGERHAALYVLFLRCIQAEQLAPLCELHTDFGNVGRVAEADYIRVRPFRLIGAYGGLPGWLSRVGEPFCFRAVFV